MADGSKIEWTNATWNPIRARRRDNPQSVGWFCVHVSDGCKNCYAERMNRRLGTGFDFKPGHFGKDVTITLDIKMLAAPLRWKRPRRIFVCSMTDLFADFVKDEWIGRVFAVMALCPQHTFQILTKRPERMREFVSSQGRDAAVALDMQEITGSTAGDDGLSWPLPNVWLGTSCEDQETANDRIPHLLATPAAIRFLSVEPLLGPIDLTALAGPIVAGNDEISLPKGFTFDALSALGNVGRGNRLTHWCIVGGESGPNARPMHPDWARSLRDQCAAAGVPFFFKQWGEWGPDDGPPGTGHDRIMEGRARAAWHDGEEWSFADSGYDIPAFSGQGEWVYRLGKKKTGRKLDGREHNEFPETAP